MVVRELELSLSVSLSALENRPLTREISRALPYCAVLKRSLLPLSLFSSILDSSEEIQLVLLRCLKQLKKTGPVTFAHFGTVGCDLRKAADNIDPVGPIGKASYSNV